MNAPSSSACPGNPPVNETLIGAVATLGEAGVKTWADKLRKLGGAAQ
jgi:hypothetical protein